MLISLKNGNVVPTDLSNFSFKSLYLMEYFMIILFEFRKFVNICYHTYNMLRKITLLYFYSIVYEFFFKQTEKDKTNLFRIKIKMKQNVFKASTIRTPLITVQLFTEKNCEKVLFQKFIPS